MKQIKKEKAKNLRQEGWSVKSIAKELNVSVGSISVWVRDIVLTNKQKENLKHTQIKTTAEAVRTTAKKKRINWQNSGRRLIKKCSKEFIAGIMLFWAEGSKKRNTVAFANSDPEMLKFFINFLRKYFNVTNKNITFCFQWYSNNTLKFSDVKKYWIKTLNIEEKNFRKCYIDYRPIKNIGKKIGKCPYGIGRLTVNSTEIVQMLFGAIQEFIGFNNESWIDKE